MAFQANGPVSRILPRTIFPSVSTGGGVGFASMTVLEPDRQICVRLVGGVFRYGCEPGKGEDGRTGDERRSVPRPEPDRRQSPEEQIARNGETGFLAELKAFAVSDAGIVLVAAVFIIGVTGFLVKTVKLRKVLPT